MRTGNSEQLPAGDIGPGRPGQGPSPGLRRPAGVPAALPALLLSFGLLLIPIWIRAQEEVISSGAAAPKESPSVERPEPVPLAPSRLDSIIIGLPPMLRLQEGIKDPVFALLVGLVASGQYGTLSGDRIKMELARHNTKSKLPYQTVRQVTRLPVLPGRTAQIRVEFHKPLKLPVPYSILGYHPGQFTATPVCEFREWMLESVALEFQDDPDDPESIRTVEMTDVHLFGLAEGEIVIDIDGWLDRLMGGSLDDTRVTALMLCRYKGEWLGVAMGYNKDGKGRSGTFDFAEDTINFPTPSELKAVGRRMRGRTEQLMERWSFDNTLGAYKRGKVSLMDDLREGMAP